MPLDFFEFNPGSDKPFLHLAHANGFPPATYRLMLEPLFAHYRVVALYARPFWDRSPAGSLRNWSLMADDLVAGLDQLGVRQAVGIGHSMGGVVTLYASVRRPDLFSRLVLIDPTFLPPRLLWKAGWMRFFGMEARPDLVEGALRRRRRWPSREEAFRHFQTRPLFKNWPEETVRDYVLGMTAPEPGGGVALCYPPEWEARIYQTLPMDVWRYARRLLHPVRVLRAERSGIFTLESERAFRKAAPGADFALVAGAGHLAPQEKPRETGRLVMDFLEGRRGERA